MTPQTQTAPRIVSVSPVLIVVASVACDQCKAPATLRLDGIARRYECTNPNCKHAIDAALVEKGFIQ